MSIKLFKPFTKYWAAHPNPKVIFLVMGENARGLPGQDPVAQGFRAEAFGIKKAASMSKRRFASIPTLCFPSSGGGGEDVGHTQIPETFQY